MLAQSTYENLYPYQRTSIKIWFEESAIKDTKEHGKEIQVLSRSVSSNYLKIIILLIVISILGVASSEASNMTLKMPDLIDAQRLRPIPASDFASHASLSPEPSYNWDTGSAWNLTIPAKTSPKGDLTISDVASKRGYNLTGLYFDLQMVGGGAPDRDDEYAVFAYNGEYNTFEFGVRMSLSDNIVKGYILYTPPGKSYVVRETDLFPNDCRTHHYALKREGERVSFTVDGRECGYLTGYSLEGNYHRVTATAHRTSDSWASESHYMVFANPKLSG